MDRTVEVRLLEGLHFESTGEDGLSVHMDSSPGFGGTGRGWRPMELLLVSLGSCTGMDVISILRKKRLTVEAYTVNVSGTQATEHPHVYTSIRIHHLLYAPDLPDEAVRRAIELSEQKYCSAYAMLVRAAEITSSFEVRPSEPAD
jgi:putative redox protein